MRTSFLVLLSLIFSLSGCGKSPEPVKNAPKSQMQKIAVKVEPVQKAEIAETHKITGEIAPLWKIDVFPKINGIVLREMVGPGSVVQKDQALAEIRQDVPGVEFSPVKILAPVAGTIIMDAVEPGATLTMQKPAYSIGKLKQVYMIASVREALIGKIKTGNPAEIMVEAYPDKKFTGKITEISPNVDPVSRTVRIKIKIANTNYLLKPGMFARATIKTDHKQGLIVPLDAVVYSGARRSVFILRDKKAKRTDVHLGVIIENKVAVTGDLHEGDLVVVMGQNLLEEGSAVEVVEGM